MEPVVDRRSYTRTLKSQCWLIGQQEKQIKQLTDENQRLREENANLKLLLQTVAQQWNTTVPPLSKVDILIHGSDHGYEVQKAELVIADELVTKNGFMVVDRPDYNSFRAVNGAFSDRPNYSMTTLAEKSVHSPLMFGIVKKIG